MREPKPKTCKEFITKCPKCGSRKFVLSIFGAICPDCFYEEKAERYLDKPKKK